MKTKIETANRVTASNAFAQAAHYFTKAAAMLKADDTENAFYNIEAGNESASFARELLLGGLAAKPVDARVTQKINGKLESTLMPLGELGQFFFDLSYEQKALPTALGFPAFRGVEGPTLEAGCLRYDMPPVTTEA
jgi:hypothetical protein